MKSSAYILLLAMAGAPGTARAQVASATLLGEIRDESSAARQRDLYRSGAAPGKGGACADSEFREEQTRLGMRPFLEA